MEAALDIGVAQPIGIAPNIHFDAEQTAGDRAVDLFEDRGYRVAIAQDGEEGLQRAQLLRPDLILLDVMLPGDDGFEVCRRLKELESTRGIPVIFMTALASTDNKVRGFAAGGIDYVTKPLQIDEVIARVGTHLKLHAIQRLLVEQNLQLEKHSLELEQRVAERTEELARSECEFRTLSENHPDDIIRFDTQGRILYTNLSAQLSFGSSAMSLLGKTVCEFPLAGNPEWTRPLLNAICKIVTTAAPEIMEFTWPNGRVSEIRLCPELNEQDEVISVLTIGRDITERRDAERMLHKRAEAIRAVVEHSPDAIARYDDQLRRTYVNPAKQQMFNLPLDQSFGDAVGAPQSTSWDLVPLLKSVFESGKELQVELPFYKANGQNGWVDLRIVPEFRPDGRVATVLSISRDISERKYAESALRESEHRYRLVFENSPISIWEEDFSAVRSWFDELRKAGVTDLEAYFDQHPESLQQCAERVKIVDINQAAMVLHDAETKDALFAGLVNTFTPESIDAFRQELVCLWRGETRTSMETVVKTLTGAPRSVTVHFAVCPGFEDSFAKVLVSLVDITERKLAENALKESEWRYREIFENVSDALYLVEVTPEGRFRNLAFNAAFEKSTGISREVLIGRDIGGMVDDHADDLDGTLTQDTARTAVGKYRRCVRAGEAIEADSVLDLPTGRRYYHSSLVPLRDESGQIYRILGLARDITERKQMEHHLQESQVLLRQLASRNEAAREDERRHLKREIHDELGQYLSALRLGISVLDIQLGKIHSPLQEETQRLITVVDSTIKVVRNVVAALRPSALDLGIVSALEWLAQEYAGKTAIPCQLQVPDGDLYMDDKSATAIFRIVQESLTNIARHAQATRVEIALERKGDNYCLEVRDNGRGFDPALRKADSFGLVSIRERALMLGGEVDIASMPGRTAIRVHFPAQE